jgi:hypothetical protein
MRLSPVTVTVVPADTARAWIRRGAMSCRRSPDKQVTASSANSPGSPSGELADLQLSRLPRALLYATTRLAFIPLEDIARFVSHRTTTVTETVYGQQLRL